MAIKYCPFRKESTTKTQVYETITTETFRPCIQEACMMYDNDKEYCRLSFPKIEIKPKREFPFDPLFGSSIGGTT